MQTFENFSSPTRETLGKILAVFRRKYVQTQAMATAKYNFQKVAFDPADQRLVEFPDELKRQAKNAFTIAANAIIEKLIYAKKPPILRKCQ